MEELYARALLYQVGLSPAGPYREALDRLFRQNPEDEFLLELYRRAFGFYRTK